jgi:hypothetical protein
VVPACRAIGAGTEDGGGRGGDAADEDAGGGAPPGGHRRGRAGGRRDRRPIPPAPHLCRERWRLFFVPLVMYGYSIEALEPLNSAIRRCWHGRTTLLAKELWLGTDE